MRSFIFGLVVCMASLSCLANSNLSLLVSSPVDIELSVESGKLDLSGQLNIDIRLTSEELKETNFVAEIRNLGVIVKKVPRNAVVIKPDPVGRGPIDIGISLVPGTKVRFEYDKPKRLLRAMLDVEIDLPDTASYDDVDEKNIDQTSREAQTGTLILNLELSQDLDKFQTDDKRQFTASVAISLKALEFKDKDVYVRSFSAQAVASTATCQIVNLASNVIYRNMCIQPISVKASVTDSNPSGYAVDSVGNVTKDFLLAQRGAMDGLWGEVSGTVAGIKINTLPWIERIAPDLKIITDANNWFLDNRSRFPNLSPDCVEIYFVEKIERESQHGAKAADGGTQYARIILSDEIVQRGLHGRLAHEFGHVIRIPHPDGPPRQGDGYVGSTGTVACVYQSWDEDHPNRNSAENILKIRITPVLDRGTTVAPSSQARPVECKQKADCGGC